jgi:exodeoxyribonuclease VIII
MTEVIEQPGAVVTPGPGIYEDVPAEVYRAWPYACSSLLWEMYQTSPRHARDRMLNGGDDSDCKAKGSCVHAALLEPERFAAEYAIGPDVKLNTKAGKEEWEAFVAANPGRFHVRGADGVDLLAMRAAVWSHPAARNLLRRRSGTEVSVVWDDAATGVRCKARLDLPCVGIGVLADLKSTRSAARRAFRRSIRDYGYRLQLAFYMEGAAARGVAFDEAAIVAVESARPYGVQVFQMDQADLEYGRQQFRAVLPTWAECAALPPGAEWPGYPVTPQLISVDEYD